MKKIIAILLALSMTLALWIPASAASADGTEPVVSADCEYPIIFVTGIGQTWTHILNPDGSYKANDVKHMRDHNWFNKFEDPIDYNLFYADSNGLKQPGVMAALLRIVGQLFASALLDRNLVSVADVQTVLEAVMSRNVLDDNGKLPADVENCLKPYPLSEYNDLDKSDFYHSIPCQFIAEQVGEENIYCFNHFAFDYLYDDADALDVFIRETVLGSAYNTKQASQVILIPMSMGAGVVNAYLDAYGRNGQVKRVISLVGAWDGSDVIADLVEGKYSDDAPEMLYHTLMPELIGGPMSVLVMCFLRAFPKAVAREVIDTLMTAIVRSLVLRTPSLLAMLPVDRYPAVEQTYLSGDAYTNVRAQTRKYYAAQLRRDDNLAALRRQGVEFYFIAGYGLRHGEGDFPYLAFFQSGDATNSDEIVPIWSAVPGVTWAPYDRTLDYSGQYVSPDGSIDLSTAFAPEQTWCFYRQKHQLEDNNTALRLAFDIAVGRVQSVSGSAEIYPQFNESRDVSGVENMIESLTAYIEENRDNPARQADVAEAQAAVDALNAMLDSTRNDREADDAVIRSARQTVDRLVPKTLKQRYKSVKDRLEEFSDAQYQRLNELFYRLFGAKGVRDNLPG